MRSRRFTASTFALLLVITLSASLSAQVAKRDSGTDLNTHKFQPQGMTIPAPNTSGKPVTIGPGALQQINALELDKKQRTPAQAKISSRVLYTSRMLEGLPAAIGVPYLQTGLEVDNQNNLYLDISARVTDGLLKQLRSMGVRVVRSNAAYHTIRAFVPPHAVESIAGLPDVKFIQPRQQAMTQEPMSHPSTKGSGPAVVQQLPPGFAQRAATVRERLAHALTNVKPSRGRTNGTGQGSVTSEGDATHRAFDARSTLGISGAGLNIGVLSDGVSNLAASQALGDLGPVTVLPGQTGSGDEGTAMLEIIHDLAPDASLFFATAFSGIDSFAQNIRDLRTAGCDIIVDDVFYFVETPFQDGQDPSIISDTNGGVVIQAVNDVTAAGAMYFSSAGNQGNLDDDFSGTYEGDFVDFVSVPPLPSGDLTLFGGGNPYDTITFNAGEPIFLFWADPLGGSTNDYDLYVLDSTGTTIVDASLDLQDGTQDPVEAVNPQAEGDLLVVFKPTAAADVFFHLDTFGGALDVVTAGQTHGHSSASAASAFSVAATPAFLAFTSGFPSGPFPDPFNSTNVVEPYSSDGPRQIFFQGDGTPITPGNFTSTGGTILQKPDVTAADGVSVTGAGGFPTPFYGTSAAAPHAAAIASLLKSGKAGVNNTDVKTALTSSAVDIEAPGVDRDSGAGILLAFEAAQALGIVPSANPALGAITPAENPGNGDGAIEAGEAATLLVELKNTGGVVDATGITATLSTTTPGVTITQDTSAYPDLTAGSGISANTTPFAFSTAFNLPCGQEIELTLAVTYTGGPSPRLLTFSVPSGPPPINILTTLDSTPPTAVTGITTATGTQTGRLFRDGVPSACGAAKTNPGIFDASGARQYDGYTFNACRNACAEITVSSDNGITLFSAAYSPSFTPGDPSANYAGDAGSSGNSASYGIDALAGTPYTVVIHELNPGGGVGTLYNVQISGCSVSCDFNVPATIPDITVTAGQSGSQTFTITPVSSLDVPVTFACSGLPAHSSCSFTPSSVTPGGSTADVQVTISTTAGAAAQLGQRTGPIYALWLPFGGLGLVTMAGVGTRKRSRKVLIALALLLLIPTLLALVSCSSSSTPPPTGGTPLGTFPVTVTSTAGASAHNSALSLTVQ